MRPVPINAATSQSLRFIYFLSDEAKSKRVKRGLEWHRGLILTAFPLQGPGRARLPWVRSIGLQSPGSILITCGTNRTYPLPTFYLRDRERDAGACASDGHE